MRHLTRSILFTLGLCLFASSAMAFPTWIGTYGAFTRHSGSNPGTFTILMNQDYVGLHAEVGVQVNGGTWTTHGMAYNGNVDGNSKWIVTPAAAFPAGATVKYYFHGWDDWGGHIYDNNNSQDYAYVVPGSSTGSVGWTTSAAIPANGALYMDIAAYNGTIHAVWAERADWNQPETVLFSKKAAGEGWTAPSQLASVNGGMTYPRIAVSSRGVHVLYGDNNQTRLINSVNGGTTWSAPIDVSSDYSTPLCRYGELRADDTYTYLAYDNFTAPETSRVRFRRIHKDATAWEAERTVYDRSSYKATVYVKDFEVRGQKVALSTYSQGWYGGMGTPFYHESTDGGQTWTERAVGSYAASYQIDADAAGHVHMATMGGPAGDGLYTAHKDIGSAWGAFNLFWPGGGTVDSIAKIDAGLVAVSTRNEPRYYELSTDGGATWSAPALIAGGNSWVSKDVRDGNTVHLLAIDYNSGLYTVISSGAAGAPVVTWIGNTYHWPSGAELDATDDLWINIESTPRGAAVSAGVAYSTDGVNWTNKDMALGGSAGANDWWHANLGKFAAGTTVRYAVAVTDGQGTTRWDNNGGQDYRAAVASSVTVQTPIFWGLDPYRYDNAKARANGRAPQESNNSFGQFDAGQAVTIVARPVENGNGNLVQTSCSSTALLHYTTTPGDWSNAQTVQGVFSPAGLSNKPIFDFFSFDLGTFPAGTSVEFWMEAKNAAGTGYAQSAGNDFDFSIAAAVGDSDSDGLPDQWELDYFGNLGQSATNNNSDLDGPTYFPIANIIEWVLGLSPTVPNDSMGIKLLWSPAYPSPGEQVNLSYFYVNEGNPLFGKPIYAHVGHNGWQGVFDTAQFGLNGRISRFQATITVPAGATEINVCFHDNAGTWDNNGGQNWRIPVQPAGGGGGSTAPSTAKAATAAGAVAATTVAPAAARTLTVKWTSPRSGQWKLVIGQPGWKNTVQLPMRTSANKVRWATYTIPEGVTEVVFAFHKKGHWETHNGQAWSLTLAGNDNHTVNITTGRAPKKIVQRTLKKTVRK